MKIIATSILSVVTIICTAQPTPAEIKKHKIRKAIEKTVDYSGTPTEKFWTYTSNGYDSLQSFYGETYKINNVFKNGKVTEKIVVRENGKNDVFTYEYQTDGSYKETMTDGSFQMKSYEWHDARGRLQKSQSPDGNTITYKYDSKGNVLSVTSDGKNGGEKINNRYTYNAKGQLIKLDKGRGGNKSVTIYQYDPKGLATKVTTKGIWEGEAFETTSSNQYNEKGLIKKTVAKSGDSVTTYEFEYEYY